MSKQWVNREGTPAEDRLKDLQENLGLGNLVNNPISDSLPDISKLREAQPMLAIDGGKLHLVIKFQGTRVAIPFTLI